MSRLIITCPHCEQKAEVVVSTDVLMVYKREELSTGGCTHNDVNVAQTNQKSITSQEYSSGSEKITAGGRD